MMSEELAGKYPTKILNARGRGLMCAFDLPTPEKRDELKNKILFIADGHHRYQTSINYANEVKEKIGILPQEFHSYERLTVKETLVYFSNRLQKTSIGAELHYRGHTRFELWCIFQTDCRRLQLEQSLARAGFWLTMIFFCVANVAYQAGLQFYDAMLPEVSTEENRGRIGGIGVAIGYLGSYIAVGLGIWLLGTNRNSASESTNRAMSTGTPRGRHGRANG
jgi:hypothetical protein